MVTFAATPTVGGDSNIVEPSALDNTPTPTRDASPFTRVASGEARRPSIQFAPPEKPESREETRTRKSSRPARGAQLNRRISSPPPPPTFQTRVSFDNFDPELEPKFDTTSFSLVRKHKNYEYTKRSRTFLCGLDSNHYSEYALEWLIDELVEDGDEIVCLRVVEKDSSIAGERSIERGRYRDEANALMKKIQEKNGAENKAVNLILEFSVGKVQDVIGDMIKIYEPAILIVGTKGRSLGGFQGLLPGSVSKWVLQHSPVPVIVVRPNSKRAKTKRKRLKDPARTGYRDLLDKSNPDGGGGHLLDHSNRYSIVPEAPPVTEEEAAAVAAAIIGDIAPRAPSQDGSLARLDSRSTEDDSVQSEGGDDSATQGLSPETSRGRAREARLDANEVPLDQPSLVDAMPGDAILLEGSPSAAAEAHVGDGEMEAGGNGGDDGFGFALTRSPVSNATRRSGSHGSVGV